MSDLDPPVHGCRRRPVAAATICALGLLVILEAIRPHAFLADDNLCYALPHAAEMWHRLVAGLSPWWSMQTPGGMDLRTDPTAIILLDPFLLLSGWLTLTPWWAATIEVAAGMKLVAGAIGWILCAERMRERGWHDLPTWACLFLWVGWTTASTTMAIQMAWNNYHTLMAALPWLAMLPSVPAGRAGIVAAAVLGCVVATSGAQAAATATAWMLAWTLAWRMAGVRVVWWPALSAGAAAAIVTGGWLLIVSTWPHGQPRLSATAVDGHMGTLDGGALLLSWVTGGRIGGDVAPFPGWPAVLGPGTTIAALAVMVAVATAAVRRTWTGATTVVAVAAALALVVACRDGGLFMGVPGLDRFRWPFRDVVFALFALHLLPMACGSIGRRHAVLAAVATASTLLALGAIAGPVPLNPTDDDRIGVLSGTYADVARSLRAGVPDGHMVAPMGDIYTPFGRCLPSLHGLHVATAYPPRRMPVAGTTITVGCAVSMDADPARLEAIGIIPYIVRRDGDAFTLVVRRSTGDITTVHPIRGRRPTASDAGHVDVP